MTIQHWSRIHKVYTDYFILNARKTLKWVKGADFTEFVIEGKPKSKKQ